MVVAFEVVGRGAKKEETGGLVSFLSSLEVSTLGFAEVEGLEEEEAGGGEGFDSFFFFAGDGVASEATSYERMRQARVDSIERAHLHHGRLLVESFHLL